MIYANKTVLLRDGTTARLRSPQTKEAAAMVAFLKECAVETPFLLRSPEECAIPTRQERRSSKRPGVPRGQS